MTIAISTKIGEGLVYAADSTTSYFETFDAAGGPQSRLIQSFHHARKLVQLETYPIGILTFGLGLIGTRNVESLVTEFERSLSPYAADAVYSVQDVAARLQAFIKDKYDAAHPAPEPPLPGLPAPTDTRPAMGVVMGGFSANEFHPDEWLMTFPDGQLVRPRNDPSGDFGVLWWGATIPLARMVLGCDPGLIRWLVDQGVEENQARSAYEEVVGQHQWTIYFDGMPVQDAIDLSVFLCNVAIGHSRFVVGPPICGGHVDVATITHDGFSWVRQKKTTVKGDSLFF